VIAAGWLALEETGALLGEAVLVALLALAPALAPTAVRRAAAALVAALLAGAVAVGSALDAPGRLWDGSLAYWDVSVPFAAAEHPGMAGVVVAGIFAFALGASLTLAARRPLAAALFTLSGAAWPATLVGAGTARGAPVLAVVLLLLAAGGKSRPLGVRGAVLASAVLVVAGLAGASSSALAKDEFLEWKRWDPYDQPDRPVSVAFVWNANYEGVEFPDRATEVLTVDGVRRPLYWRATTLDTYDGEHWVEDLEPLDGGSGSVDALGDALLPDRGRDPRGWLEAEVTIRALRDNRLPAPSMPVRYDAPELPFLQLFEGGVAVSAGGLRRETEYTVASYAPRPTPAQLAASRPAADGAPIDRYLEIVPGALAPRWGTLGRAGEVRALLSGLGPTGSLSAHRPLYEVAERIAGGRQTPYAAVVALETWLRSEGGFRYDEQPGPSPNAPALVEFVTRTKEGYCQHYAGAMTLMLRMLGIPARVAAGFTSGSYDDDEGPRWSVTDHDAHAWVEAWFDGWGWLPFDPTPGRGQLGGSYSTSSPSADIPAIEDALRGDGNPNIGPSFDIDGGLSADGGGGGPFGRSEGVGLVTLLLLGGGAALLLIGTGKLVRRRLRYVGADARAAAGACRAELADFLADQGVALPSSATPAEVAAIVRRELGVDAGRFTSALAAARFAPPGEAASAARRARKELAALIHLLRAQLTRPERMRGLVSLRSLGLTG
jgi:transglutaminase-like putative cysteine protease